MMFFFVVLQAYFDSVHRLNEYGNQAWFCIDLLEILCQLAERGHATTVRVILEYPLDHCPEVLLVGTSQISVRYLSCFIIITFV